MLEKRQCSKRACMFYETKLFSNLIDIVYSMVYFMDSYLLYSEIIMKSEQKHSFSADKCTNQNHEF